MNTLGLDIAAPKNVSVIITEMDANRFATHSLQDVRILRVLAAALDAVDPYFAVQKELPEFSRPVFGLAIGKAAIPMMDALVERVPLLGALAITKFVPHGTSKPYTVLEGGHPIPDARSFQAGAKVLQFVASLNEDDTLVCLISGGASALVTVPFFPLEQLQTLTSLLLSSGARIDEINTLRRQLDGIKGGGLARSTLARVISLILSDVIGNPLEVIASGPTVADPTTRQDALAILKKYDVHKQASARIYRFLESENPIADLPEPPSGLQNAQNIIIGDNTIAAQAALEQARQEGFHADILTNELQGEAREVGVMLAKNLREELTKRPRPFCLIAGGETTVTIRGKGQGGRNQELALSAVDQLSGLEKVMLIALATDGDDGPTDAAGAVVTGESAQRAESLGLRAADYLSRNDAYPFFQALDDLIMTGPTGTNVNDIVLLCAL